MPTLPGSEDFEGDLLADKAHRGGRTGGSTGVGGGGGFGGAFGGGGSGFLGSGGSSFGGDMLGPQKRRFIQGANGQIPLTYTPMKAQDTVPAMLSPGEYVVNNRATAMPGAQEFLAALNAAGNGGHYAEGGPVPNGMMLDQDTLRLLLQLLSKFAGQGEMEQENEGQGQPMGVQHFAWGGMAQPQQGGFNKMPSIAPQMPQNRMAGGGMGSQARRPGNAPVGRPAQPIGPMPSNPVNSQMPGLGGTTPQMGVPGQFGPGFGGAGDTTGQNGYIQSLYDLLNQYGATGMFSPEGDPRMMRAVQDQATSNADAMRARQQNQMALGGMDAGQAGSYAMQQQLRGQGDIANALNQAQLGQLQAQQQFGRDLFGNVTNFNADAWKAWNDYVHQQRLGG